MAYFAWTGIMLNIVIAAWLTWNCLLLPTLEATSITRWYWAISRKHSVVKPAKTWAHIWMSNFHLFGRDFDSMSNRLGRWDGIGKWTVYSGEEE
ncbi:hypothetical protein SAMN05216516_12017 [Izhakiella capsodis]|uniref:Uncharacterized protein n=1 Tax=Izhakiella capsodis TaxID=1367852 RepID=A0A1I5BQA3_9GAMM|nr:hypothetical protein [Izhakiella capsodis]SFN76872.1 hypothetical protein SAMN05216516_12017 [Izhakiella capsodis]